MIIITFSDTKYQCHYFKTLLKIYGLEIWVQTSFNLNLWLRTILSASIPFVDCFAFHGIQTFSRLRVRTLLQVFPGSIVNTFPRENLKAHRPHQREYLQCMAVFISPSFHRSIFKCISAGDVWSMSSGKNVQLTISVKLTLQLQ